MNILQRFVLFALLVLAACAPLSTAPTQHGSGVPTLSLAPAASPTAFSPSSLHLESVLLWPGDLPSGFATSRLQSERSDLTKAAPEPAYFVSQLISYTGQPGGRVEVLAYTDPATAASAYKAAVADFPSDLPQPVSVIVGEDRGTVASTFSSSQSVSLAFTRCNSLVVIQLLQTSSADTALAYGKRLDSRLMPLICQP